jgi:suppressor of G2 allele of SKP1
MVLLVGRRLTARRVGFGRHDWYQTDQAVIITILIKGAARDSVRTDGTETSVRLCAPPASTRAGGILRAPVVRVQVSIAVKLHTGSDFMLDIDLAHRIDPRNITVQCMSTKVRTGRCSGPSVCSLRG